MQILSPHNFSWQSIDFDTGAVLPLDKPYGWSSFDAIRYVQRLVQQRLGIKKFKIGHAGTLDPLATGVLVVCLGKATKQAETLQAQHKEYVIELRLGATTASYDLETPPENYKDTSNITPQRVQGQLLQMLGKQEQLPPMFSAKQIDGQRAYILAREGKVVDIKPNQIEITALDLVECELPHLSLRVQCTKGSYMRSIARDLGEALGCGAYLTALRRTASGDFTENSLVSIDYLQHL